MIIYPLAKKHIYTDRRGLTKGLKRKGGLGFFPLNMQLTQEEKFFMNLDLSGQTVYDIGGGYGLFTIFFARAVGEKGKVVAFEPNPELCNKIIENAKLNKFNNVEVRQIALGKEGTKATLAFLPLAPGCGSIEEKEKARILQSKAAKTVEVEVDSIDHQIATSSLPKPDFIKIDVQGLELDVLVGMSKTIQEYKPKLFVEIHRQIVDLQKVMKFIIANGYSIYSVFNEYEHLYCI